MLKVDGHEYSPTLYLRILHMASVVDGFDTAAVALEVVGELSVSSRQINKLASEAGAAMAEERDARTEKHVQSPLPRVATTAEMPVDLAAVFGDGGRMRTRAPNQGSGVHRPHWRETKNAGYSAAKVVSVDATVRWQQYLEWVSACWQGRVGDVLGALRDWQTRIGLPPEGETLADTDPRKILQKTLTYLTNNRSRMAYASYRRQGLPTTSSLAESLVKQVSKRVKGTEKFWNDGVSGEAILQLRAAVISDGDRLAKWVQNRPISAFSPRCRPLPLANAT